MRIKILQICWTIFFILVCGCLYYLQIIKGPLYRDLSSRNSIRLLDIPAPRGIIYDRYNKVAAGNILSFGVFIVPQEVTDLDEEIKMLSKILRVSEDLLMRNYKRNYRAPFAPCELIRDVSKRDAILIEELKLDMHGVLVKEVSLRMYPYQEALAHITGYIREIDRGELELLKSYGYRVKDLIGKDGMERFTDAYLRGRDGGMQVQVDNRGRQVKILNSRPSKKGNDVYLTIDAELQNFVWKVMKGRKGSVIFMDPYNGEILSLVSSPSYNPNGPLGGALNDRDAPFLNRAISGQYPPGSLFKIVVALAGLESEVIRSETTFVCHGKLNIGPDVFHCWNRDGHGAVNLERAIIESCNSYFYNLGILVKSKKIIEYAKQFGFGRKTGVELLGEMEGFVPSKAWKRREENEMWWTGDTANLSIGQGYLLATPLQIIRLIAMVANGGEIVEPHILEKVGNLELTNRYKNIKLRVKREHIELIKKAMKGVVLEGTGGRAYSNIISISGKTGTSQAGGGLKTLALFGGFAPSDDPKICFIFFLEHGGSGGDIPALMARKSVEYWERSKHEKTIQGF